jgi:multiple sugar transport system substrate-binding protein
MGKRLLLERCSSALLKSFLLCYLLILSAGCASDTDKIRIATGDSGAGLVPHRKILDLIRKQLGGDGPQLSLQPISGGDYYTRLLTQFASSDPPDILQLGDDSVGWFAAQGCLEPLDDYLAAEPQRVEPEFYQACLLPGKFNGHQYLLPKDYTPMAVYCNRKLFQEAGLSLPNPNWQWDDLLKLAQATTKTKDGQPQYGLVLPGSHSGLLEWLVLLKGGQVFVDEQSGYLGGFDGPEAIWALQQLADLYHRRKCTPVPTELGSFGGGNSEFEQGRAAMKISGYWPAKDLANNPQIDLVTLPLPGYHGRKANILYWAGLAISKHPKRTTQRQKLNWQVIRTYCGPEGSQEFSQWGLPAVRKVAQSSLAASRNAQGFSPQQVWLDQLADVKSRSYTRDALWLQVGQNALYELQEGIIVDPEISIPAWAHQVALRATKLRRIRLDENRGPQ